MKNDDRPPFLLAQAELLTAREKWDEAEARLEELTALDPLNGTALMMLGQACLKQKKNARASFAFEAAYALPDFSYPAGLALANLASQARDYKKAEGYLETALKEQPTQEVRDYLAQIRILARDRAPSPPAP